MGTHLYPSRDEWISGRDGDRCPEAAPGPTRHDAEIKPWSTRTNGDGMGVNKGATWAPAGGVTRGRRPAEKHFRWKSSWKEFYNKIFYIYRFDKPQCLGAGQLFVVVVDGYKLIYANKFCLF